MLTSFSNKFIYIKAIKVSGTSIQVALAENCKGPKDIVTPVAHHKRETPGYSPQNYLDKNKEIIFDSHNLPIEIKTKLGSKTWNSFTKIVAVRNPWEALVSRYKGYCVSMPDFRKKYPTLEAWIKSNGIYTNQNYYFWEDGKLTCDEYIKYENLEHDFSALCIKYNLKSVELPRLKINADSRHYSTFISDKLIKQIGQKCLREINTFGYSFERLEAYDPHPWSS